MIENLSKAQIDAILEALPVDITFADEKDMVKLWNKHETRIFKQPMEALGKDLRGCHSSKSIDKVNQLITDFKNSRKDSMEYNIKFNGRIIHIKNLAVRDKNGKYLGIMEIDQDITDFKIEG